MTARADGRVVLLGATGTTGRYVARAMVRQGLLPILAGPDEQELESFAEDLAASAPTPRAVDIAVVDATSASEISELLPADGDVLVSAIDDPSIDGTVALRAAIHAGCGYLDCAWEPQFLRKVFSGYAAPAVANGSIVLPGFGCYYVSGSLAATIAVRRTMTGSRPPARVDIGYFVIGHGRGGAPGTALINDSFRWSEGRIKTERPGVRIRSFDLGGGKHQEALSLGSPEHFTVPRMARSITEVNVYVGWFGRFTRAAAMAGVMAGSAARMPALGGMWDSVVKGLAVSTATANPETAADGASRTVVMLRPTTLMAAFSSGFGSRGPGRESSPGPCCHGAPECWSRAWRLAKGRSARQKRSGPKR